jgi:hypothetical protein
MTDDFWQISVNAGPLPCIVKLHYANNEVSQIDLRLQRLQDVSVTIRMPAKLFVFNGDDVPVPDALK